MKRQAMQSSLHTLEEVHLRDAGLVSVRSSAALRDFIVELELGLGNFTDRFQGDAKRLLAGAACLSVEIHCRRCYWAQCVKTFETPEAAQLYMHDRPDEPDATSDIWDYAELFDDGSEQLRYWRSILGTVPLRHLRLSTSLEIIDVICEQIEVHIDPERRV